MPKQTKTAGTAGKTTRPAQPVPAPIATPNHKGTVYTGTLGQAHKTNPIPANLANIITPATPAYWCNPGTVIAAKKACLLPAAAVYIAPCLTHLLRSTAGLTIWAWCRLPGLPQRTTIGGLAPALRGRLYNLQPMAPAMRACVWLYLMRCGCKAPVGRKRHC